MLGWMDDEALHRTLTTGRATFWSRSRREYWGKGDTSGHVQHVRGPCPGLRRRHAARQGRPGRRRLPHRRPHLLRRRRPAARGRPDDRRDVRTATRRPTRAHGDVAHDQQAPRAPARMCVMPSPPRRSTSRPSASWPRTAGSSRSRRRLLADGETPVGLYRKLAGGRPGTFLLESAEHGRVVVALLLHRRPVAATLTERDGQAHWLGDAARRRPHRAATRWPRCAPPSRPCTPRGLDGLPAAHRRPGRLLGYDAVRRLERLPRQHARRPAASRSWR